MALKQDSVHFPVFPKQNDKIEHIVLKREGIFLVSIPQRLTYTNIGRLPLPLVVTDVFVTRDRLFFL